MKERDEALRASRPVPSWGAIRGWGLLTPWGSGVSSLPANVWTAAAGQRSLSLPTPPLEHGRLRRATRACLLGVAAVEAALEHGYLGPDDVAGSRTALVFASASAYAAANWTFLIGGTENALHFPYTAPSAVPGEVSIHYGITGPYLTLLSGANAGIEALWQAVTLLNTGQCDRALVLGVETFQECAALYAAGRWLLGTPLSEVAGCLILEPHPSLASVRYRAAHGASELRHMLQAEQQTAPGCVYLCAPTVRDAQEAAAVIKAQWPGTVLTLVHERCGFCLACASLMALMCAMTAESPGDSLCLSHWWDDWSMLRWPGFLDAGGL